MTPREYTAAERRWSAAVARLERAPRQSDEYQAARREYEAAEWAMRAERAQRAA